MVRTDGNCTTMKALDRKLLELLTAEKKRLIVALGNKFETVAKRSDYGIVGTISDLDGKLFVNCNKKGGPDKSVGVGNGQQQHYLWIPVTYSKKIPDRKGYFLYLNREGFDQERGTFHSNFFRLQFAVHTFDNPRKHEIGGQARLTPKPTSEGLEVLYDGACFFPRSTDKSFSSPWGHAGFWRRKTDHPEGITPKACKSLMDMTSEEYDPEKVAELFIALIKHDIQHQLEQ